MTSLAIREDDVLLATHGETRETGLMLRPNLSSEEWEDVGHRLGQAHRASAWWIGDWINFGEKKWGERYQEAQRITGLSNSTLRSYASICQEIPFVVRHNKVSFRAHAAVAPLPDEEKVVWLERAAASGWGSNELRAQLAPQKQSKLSPQKRHSAVIDTIEILVRLGERWQREMTDALTPPEARKQLTQIRKAQELLAEVADAVEYRAATLHTFVGR